jgi:hypothetical protein
MEQILPVLYSNQIAVSCTMARARDALRDIVIFELVLEGNYMHAYLIETVGSMHLICKLITRQKSKLFMLPMETKAKRYLLNLYVYSATVTNTSSIPRFKVYIFFGTSNYVKFY